MHSTRSNCSVFLMNGKCSSLGRHVRLRKLLWIESDLSPDPSCLKFAKNPPPVRNRLRCSDLYPFIWSRSHCARNAQMISILLLRRTSISDAKRRRTRRRRWNRQRDDNESKRNSHRVRDERERERKSKKHTRNIAELIPAPGNLINDSIYKQFIIITGKNDDRKIVL